MDRQRWRGLLLVMMAGILYSTAGLFTRALHYDAWTVLAWRGVYGAVFTLAVMAVQEKHGLWRSFVFTPWQWGSIPLLAMGAICYIFALKVTTVADVMVVYATMPFVTSIVAWLWGRERPSGRQLVAGSLAMLGVGVMMAGSFGSGSRLLGIGLTMAMNFSFATMLVGARRQPGSNTGLYVVATLLSAIVSFSMAPGESVAPFDMVLLALFGIFSLGLAMAFFMAGARLIPPAEVGLVGILDVVIGPALVWFVFDEAPGLSAMLGGVIIIGALVWHLWPDLTGARTIAPTPVDNEAVVCPERDDSRSEGLRSRPSCATIA